MKKRDKKAQAQIITVVLIILIVLVAVVIVWNVVQTTVQTSSEQISVKQIITDLKINSVYIPADNQEAYVSVTNSKSGEGDISSLIFTFTGSSYIYKYPLAEEIPKGQETKVYNITAKAVKTQNPDFVDFSTITSVSIAFEVQTNSGDTITSTIKNEFKKDLRKDTTLPDKINTPVYEGDGEECTPETCSTLNYYCGTWNDGCGGTLSCGTCNYGNYTCNSTGDCS